MSKHLISALKARKIPNTKTCDLTLKVGNDVVRVHSSMMRKKSIYFREMFPKQNGKAEKAQKSLVVEEAQIEAVMTTINYIYGQDLGMSLTSVIDTVKLSNLWNIAGLESKCVDFLQQNIDAKSCVTVKKISQQLVYEEVEAMSDDFMFENLDQVVDACGVGMLEEKEFTNLVDGYPGAKNEFGLFDIKSRDAVLWKAVTDWVHHAPATRESLLCKMIQSCPFGFYDLSFVQEEILESRHVVTCESCTSHVTTGIIDTLDHRMTYQEESVVFSTPDVCTPFCDPQSCFFALSVANKNNREDIAAEIEEYVFHNFEAVTKTDGFRDLSKEEFLHFLQSQEKECASEVGVWNAALGWIKHKPERSMDFPEIFKLIKLDLLPREFLRNTVSKEELVSSSIECKDILISALFDSIGH